MAQQASFLCVLMQGDAGIGYTNEHTRVEKDGGAKREEGNARRVAVAAAPCVRLPCTHQRWTY